MVTIEELKLGNRTLEALKFLLEQITELEAAVNQIDMSELKSTNELTKEQITTLANVKEAVERINSELLAKKADFDDKKQNFDSNMSAFRLDKADFDDKKADFDAKNTQALSNFAFISSNVEKINSTSSLLTEAKAALAEIKPIEQRTQAALEVIANSQAKFAELDVLKATLLELKKSLESISVTGLINDSSIGETTTYSSKKIAVSLSTKLDISEKEAMFSGGKIKTELLPKINADTLSGKTASEFELKSESTTKISTLTQNIGQLNQKVTTLETTKINSNLMGANNGIATLNGAGKIPSNQVDAYTKTESDNRFLKKTDKIDAYTKQESDDKFALKTELLKAIPAGSYLLYSSNTNIPDGFLRCDGSALDKTTYATLFTVIGYTYGRSGDKFLLPNFSDGKFMRSIGGNAAALGTAQQDAIRNIQGEVQTDRAQIQSARGVFKGPLISAGAGINGSTVGIGRNFDFDASRVVPTANENRPYNMAVVVLIKY